MNIVVLVKQVPDTEAERTLRPEDSTLDREAVEPVINENDEFAIEQALRLKDDQGGRVTVLTLGPEQAVEALRRALAMGADEAVHVCDPALHGACAVQTATVLATALDTVEWDLVLAGSEATDSRMAVLPAMLAEVTGAAQLTWARRVRVDGASVTVERVTADGYDVVAAELPAVVSVVAKINEPRYPSFRGVMAAKTKPVRRLGLAGLGLSGDAVGLAGATSEVVSFEIAPPRPSGQIVDDDGSGGLKIAEFLAARGLV